MNTAKYHAALQEQKKKLILNALEEARGGSSAVAGTQTAPPQDETPGTPAPGVAAVRLPGQQALAKKRAALKDGVVTTFEVSPAAGTKVSKVKRGSGSNLIGSLTTSVAGRGGTARTGCGGIELLAGAEEDVGKLRGEELASGASGAVQDEHGQRDERGGRGEGAPSSDSMMGRSPRSRQSRRASSRARERRI